MSNITSLSFWKDTGYTEGCLTKPPINASLPTADMVIDTPVAPDKGRLFSELHLKVPYSDLYDMSYLKADYNMNNGEDITVYGWIDSVSVESDTDGFPNTYVRWHIDYWRTYNSIVTYGNGLVTRRPGTLLSVSSGEAHPPQKLSYRYRTVTASYPLTLQENTALDVWWVIARITKPGTITREVTMVTTTGEETTTTVTQTTEPYVVSSKIIAFPIAAAYGGMKVAGGNAPSFSEVYNGKWDEELKVLPENIISAFISPIPPSTVSGDGTSTAFSMSGWVAVQYGSKYIFELNALGFGVTTTSLPIGNITTGDLDEYYITGFDGETIGTIPYGVVAGTYDYRLIYESVSAYIQIRFGATADAREYSHLNGLCFTIPLPTLEVTENSWSSYNMAGTRDRDLESRRIEAEKAAVNGGIQTLTSGVSGALNGALTGAAVGGPIGAVGGAVLGGVSSALTGAISTSLEQKYLTGTYNDSMQAMEDSYHAAQPDGLLMAGAGFDAMLNGQQGINLRVMSVDDYSRTYMVNNADLYGIKVSEPRESCSALIYSGGPIQITNLEVTGAVPVEAKNMIREMFARGVLLK